MKTFPSNCSSYILANAWLGIIPKKSKKKRQTSTNIIEINLWLNLAIAIII